MSWRDLHCGDVRPEHVGQRVTLAGWAARRRDHGGLVFVDLRDETGVCQLVINPERAPEAFTAAHDVRNEFVLQAEGTIVRRTPETVNPKMATGEVELQVAELRREGVACDADYAGRSLKGQLTQAQRLGAKTIAIWEAGWKIRRPGEKDVQVDDVLEAVRP